MVSIELGRPPKDLTKTHWLGGLPIVLHTQMTKWVPSVRTARWELDRTGLKSLCRSRQLCRDLTRAEKAPRKHQSCGSQRPKSFHPAKIIG